MISLSHGMRADSCPNKSQEYDSRISKGEKWDPCQTTNSKVQRGNGKKTEKDLYGLLGT
jgi:hypothetical protein